MAPKAKYPDAYNHESILFTPLKSELLPLRIKALKYLHSLEEQGYYVEDIVQILDLKDVSI